MISIKCEAGESLRQKHLRAMKPSWEALIAPSISPPLDYDTTVTTHVDEHARLCCSFCLFFAFIIGINSRLGRWRGRRANENIPCTRCDFYLSASSASSLPSSVVGGERAVVVTAKRLAASSNEKFRLDPRSQFVILIIVSLASPPTQCRQCQEKKKAFCF
jgi:hypothetical protein